MQIYALEGGYPVKGHPENGNTIWLALKPSLQKNHQKASTFWTKLGTPFRLKCTGNMT